MTDPDGSSERDPLDLLVEQFLARRRAEPTLTVEQFVLAHPRHAEGLRDLLPTIVALEAHKRERASSGSGRRRASVPQLERLGEFRIVGEIGRGGMGVVFEAVQESLGRKVALKVLPQAALLTGNQLERFRREAQIAAQLHHSNIVPVFGSGESDGYHWYAMQFIAGVSLDQWRSEQTAAPPTGSGAWKSRARFVARLGVQAASALHYAHGLGTLHRDIKPGNLLLETSDHLWVTDFGLAKALEADGLTHSGDLLGTLQYMAPEQFAGNYDVRSEVYALGVTLYELLTLRPAFAGSSRSELMERIRTMRPESLRKLCPEAPEDLVVVVEKAMARDPGDRYQDADALQRDLQAFLEDRPIQARRMSPAGVVWRWCRRNRGMAALAASTALAFVVAGVTGWVAYGITDEARSRAVTSAAEASAQAAIAAQQSERAEKNLKGAIDAFGKVFDALVGPDPALALEEDEETGEQTVLVRTVVEPRDIALLQEMLAFYGQFAAQNAGNEALQLETARANRRVGAICARLGTREDLETAAAAYQRALAGLRGLAGRDREVANVYVELAQLEQRRLRPLEAERLYGEALALLAALPNAATKGVRLDSAKAQLLLAQSLLPRRGPGGMRPVGGGPGGGAPSFDRERSRRAREHLQQVVPLVDGLLLEEPANAEYRVMKARTQLLSARLTSRGPGQEGERREREAERTRLFAGGLTILREVVRAHPERDAYRFELVQALLESRAQRAGESGPGRGRGGERPPERMDRERPDRDRSVGDEELAVLREANEHAELLLRENPQMLEYRALAGTVGIELGSALRAVPADLPAAVAAARLRDAETVLLTTLTNTVDQVALPELADPRFLLQVLDLRRELVHLYIATNRRDEAEAQIGGILEVLEMQLAAVPTGAAPSGLSRLLEMIEARQLQSFERLLQRLGAPALQQRLEALRKNLREQLQR